MDISSMRGLDNPTASAGINMAVWSTHPQQICHSLCLAIYNLQLPTGDIPHTNTSELQMCPYTGIFIGSTATWLAEGRFPKRLYYHTKYFSFLQSGYFSPKNPMLSLELLYVVQLSLQIDIKLCM